MALNLPNLGDSILEYDIEQTNEINGINLIGSRYYFNNASETGLARPFPTGSESANVYRMLTIGVQDIANQFIITEGGYSIEYIGDKTATFMLSCGGGLRLTGSGWTRLHATINNQVVTPNSYFTRRDGEFISNSLSLAIRLSKGDKLRVQLTGFAGTITDITSTWFQLTRISGGGS